MSIGILGGSGLYDLETLRDARTTRLDTPYGEPSDAFVQGTWSGVPVVFLPRHGAEHRLLPSEINHRANLYGFKVLGVERVLSVSAVGSLREDLRPRDAVLPDQYFDRTKRSADHTFFGGGVVAHVAFAEPVCGSLRAVLRAAAEDARDDVPDGTARRVHDGGTYVNMEGPAFSTRAESEWYRSCGFDVIGMTSLAEAKLSREAGLCYAALAMVTDYDCWHPDHESVSVELILETLRTNTQYVKRILERAVPAVSDAAPCPCRASLEGALITPPGRMPPERRDALAPILRRPGPT